MEPIENTPNGWEEHKQNNDTSFDGLSDKEEEKVEVDDSDNDLAGIASGNVPEEELEDHEDESASDEVASDDPRGFMGDFAEPQHDDE